MATIGALGFGMVFGWASGFVAWSKVGSIYKASAIVAALICLVRLESNSTIVGLVGIAMGLLAHEGLLGAIRWRIR